MTLFRCSVLTAAVAALLCVNALADDQAKAQRQRLQIRPGAGVASGPLVAADLQEKLSLTAEQKEKLAKVEKEFADKTKDAEAKIKEASEKVRQDKNREAFAKIREMTQEVEKVRGEYADKVKALLTDEQKKKFDEAKQTGRRPGIQPPNVRPLPFGRAGDSKPDLSSKDVQEKLNLTAEQKEKLEKLHKDYESKTQEVLTEEQKKKFEELKKQPARPGLRRPGTAK